MKAVLNLTTAQTVTGNVGAPPKTRREETDFINELLEEHFEQLSALAWGIEGRLADLSEKNEDGGYKNEYPPLTEWRMAQVLRDMLSSTQVQTDIAHILRERKAAAEVAHV